MKGFILPARGKNILLVLLGNALYALAVDMFVLPCGLITGGTTGLALATRYWLDVPVAGFVLVSNIIMFVVGALAMGRWFAFNTALSTFCYPLFLDLFARIPGIDGFTRDPMLGTIFAGVLIGVAIGLVIGAGASTGGMDIPPLVLQKKLRIPVSVSLYVFDCLILLLQALFQLVGVGFAHGAGGQRRRVGGVFRRPEAEDRDRESAFPEPQAAGLRRAGERAGRIHSGADSQPVDGPAG